MDLRLDFPIRLMPPGLLALSVDVQSLLVDLLVGGAAFYVGWSLWRSWRGKAGCASRCHSCSAPEERTKSSSSSPRYPLKQL